MLASCPLAHVSALNIWQRKKSPRLLSPTLLIFVSILIGLLVALDTASILIRDLRDTVAGHNPQ